MIPFRLQNPHTGEIESAVNLTHGLLRTMCLWQASSGTQTEREPSCRCLKVQNLRCNVIVRQLHQHSMTILANANARCIMLLGSIFSMSAKQN